MNVASRDPRTKFLDAARAQFAERGFYGVSLTDVATELGLTKQSILYHFRTKEALYGAVLAETAGRLDQIVTDHGASYKDLVMALYAHLAQAPHDAQLIMRELLDNPIRADHSQIWYMRPFLNAMVARLGQWPGREVATQAELMAEAYQAIGAIHYFLISGPTLRGIWGTDQMAEIEATFLPTLWERTDPC